MKTQTNCFFLIWLLWMLTAIPPVFASTAINPRELEVFMDDMVTSAMEENHIMGSVICVVSRGEKIFSKGYGYADLKDKTPVDPSKTLFKIASISKLFTWTAVMQLIESGQLDPNQDIKSLIDPVSLSLSYPQPVTIKHLMNHSGGFEENFIGLFKQDKRALAEVLADNIPVQILPPGTIPRYSNFSTALCGHIISNISGMTWEAYIKQNILEPLSMKHTTVYLPPEKHRDDLATPYDYANGHHQIARFEYLPLTPAGAISSTADDMANFMIAHLQKGRFRDQRILKKITAETMHKTSFSGGAGVNGWAHGFMELSRNGVRIIGHGGGFTHYKSRLALLPEKQTGIFISVNTSGGNRFRTKVLNRFIDHFFSKQSLNSVPERSELITVDRNLEGFYTFTRNSPTTIGKIASVFYPSIRIQFDNQGNIISKSNDKVLSSDKWIQIDSDLFQAHQGSDRIAFKRNEQTDDIYLLAGPIPYKKTTILETLEITMGILAISVSIIFITFMILSGRIINSYIRSRARPAIEVLCPWSASLLLLAFILCLGIFFSDPQAITFGVPFYFKVGLTCLMCAIFPSVGALIYTFKIWINSKNSRIGKISYTLPVVSMAVFIWWAYFWNMIGYNL